MHCPKAKNPLWTVDTMPRARLWYARTQALDTIANNLANASTVGFRARTQCLQFGTRQCRKRVQVRRSNQAINSYGILSGTTLDQSQGALQKTGNDLDLASKGPGFFVVQTANGPVYTRNGAFQVSSHGQLITSTGDAGHGRQGRHLHVCPDRFRSAPDGTISSNGAVTGKLKVVEFPAGYRDDQCRQHVLFRVRQDRVIAATNSSVRQGMLESSNVNPICRHGRAGCRPTLGGNDAARAFDVQLGNRQDGNARPAKSQLKEIKMFHALYTAASGMTAQQLNLDNIANNLANSSTAGFQSRRVQFSDLLYQNDIMPGAAATQQTTVASGLQIGLGTRPGNTEIVQTQGDLSSTGNPLDFAIQGSGFFQILLPNGQTGYTRAGSFQTDAQGNLVTANGDALQPAINIPTAATNITVGQDGTVSVSLPGQTQAQQVGVIQLATFANPGGLNSIGNNMYLPTTASGDPVVGAAGGSEGLGTIQQGMLEQSNVNVVDEFVNMILAQRSYESNSRVVKAADEMLQQLNQLAQ